MCDAHGSVPFPRRLVLKGAAGSAVVALVGAGRAAAQTGPTGSGQAPLADGSGDAADLPTSRPAPAGTTTSTAGSAATADRRVGASGATTSAAVRYASQNGWEVPTTNDSRAIGIATYTVPGTSVRLSVRSGDTATVLLHVARRFAQLVEPLGASCGGYAWRENVNSPGTWSNHASGTAIDLNWNDHPNGASGTFTPAEVEAIRVILGECRGVVRWGGDYTSTRDEMHFEINVPPGDTRLSQLAGDLGVQPRRLATVDAAGALQVKEGGLYATWVQQPGTFSSVVADASRLGAVTTGGDALVKDGSLSNGWVLVATGVAQLALGGGRIAVVGTDGSLMVKEGGTSTFWTTLRTDGVSRVALHGNRIAAIYRGGLQVKEGSVGAGWVQVTTRATDVALDGRKLGVVEDGWIRIKEGPLGAQWVTVAQGDGVRLSGERIIALAGGTALVKTGVHGLWDTLVGPGVGEVVLQADRILAAQDGVVLLKEGPTNARWVVQTDGVRAVALSG